MRFSSLLLCCAALVVSACHPGPVIDAGAKQPPVGGTIAGLVTTQDRSVAVPGRLVTAVETRTGARFEATTAENGGYTMKVPEGTYRIDVELRAGEALVKRPDDTRVRNSDLDAQRDFVIGVKAAPARQ
jgi:hypothetical protein